MANNKPGKQFLNFINSRNKRKRANFELDDIEDTDIDDMEEQIVYVIAQAVAHIVKERPTKARGPREEKSLLNIFGEHDFNNWSETEFKKHIHENTRICFR